MMRKPSLAWLPVFIVIGAMFVGLPPMVARQDSVLRTYRSLVEVDALAHERYVEPIDSDRLVRGSIQGMLRELDRYCSYIGPDKLGAFERRQAGGYVGIGVELGMRSGRPTVIAPIEGSPALVAGIRDGDVIVSIDGAKAQKLSIFEIEERLVGEPGTTAHITILHADAQDPVKMAITRGPVRIRSVRGVRREDANRWDYLIDPVHHIGYVRVTVFRKNTAAQFDAALQTIRHQGVRGLMIDLRGNPGGITKEAVALVDRFVDEGLILSTVTRLRAVREYWATRPGTDNKTELVVLINGGSASASEIVAGSLQDHERAVIVGERSFGKGCVQQLIYLESQKAAVKLTAAYYHLPSGRMIHRTAANRNTASWGITPDVEVRRTTAGTPQTSEPPETDDLLHDPQVQAALTVLAKRLRAPGDSS